MHHSARRIAPTTYAVGMGQPGRSPDPGTGAMAVLSRGDALVYTVERIVVEHGRVDSAHYRQPGISWTISANAGANY